MKSYCDLINSSFARQYYYKASVPALVKNKGAKLELLIKDWHKNCYYHKSNGIKLHAFLIPTSF